VGKNPKSKQGVVSKWQKVPIPTSNPLVGGNKKDQEMDNVQNSAQKEKRSTKRPSVVPSGKGVKELCSVVRKGKPVYGREKQRPHGRGRIVKGVS